MNQRLTRRSLIVASIVAPSLAHPGSIQANEASPVASPSVELLPDSPAGQQLEWVIDVINGELPMPTTEEVEKRFTAEFMAAVPAPVLISTFEELHLEFAPAEVIDIVDEQTPLLISALVATADGSRAVVTVAVEEAAPHLIEGLLFAPADQGVPEVVDLAAWSELEAALTTENGAFGIAASQLVDGNLQPIHKAADDTPFAIGSCFKLYVLAAVAKEIAAGNLAWDTEVEVVKEYLSVPSGVTQYEPLGTKLPVEVLALRMISISDNTATDLLIHAVGRDKVEAAFEELGNSHVRLNLPVLTTREMTIIKLGDEDRRTAFAAADEATRRSMLEEIADEPLPDLAAAAAWDVPIEIDSIEWFASMNDLERAHLWHRDAWTRSGLEPLESILTANPGVPIDTEIWKLVAFKGGSEPGVLTLAWLLEHVDGSVYTFASAVNDQSALVEDERVALAAAGAFALLPQA